MLVVFLILLLLLVSFVPAPGAQADLGDPASEVAAVHPAEVVLRELPQRHGHVPQVGDDLLLEAAAVLVVHQRPDSADGQEDEERVGAEQPPEELRAKHRGGQPTHWTPRG